MMVLGRTMHHRKSSSDSSNPAFSEPLRALELAFREADLRKTEGYRRGLLPGRPTLIEHGPLRMLISAAPSVDSVARYAQYLKSHNVRHVVRVCEPTYPASRLRGAGMEVYDWTFCDGDAPSQEIIDKWLALLDEVYHLNSLRAAASSSGSLDTGSAAEEKETVAVHCMAGLGRAPVLVAVALIEMGMHPFEAVGRIRGLRRGAINSRQMAFLETYQRRPPPNQVKQRKGRSNTLVGSFWAGIKATRGLRPKSPMGNRNYAIHVANSR